MPFIRPLLSLALFVALASFASADTQPPLISGQPNSVNPLIRVLLARHFSGLAHVIVTADGPFSLKDTAGAIVVEGSTGDRFDITVSADAATGQQGVSVASATPDYDDTGTKTKPQASPTSVALIVATYGAGTTIGIAPSLSAQPVRYRGSVEFSPGAVGKLRVVDIVPLEDYVRGVVKAEIGDAAPLAAIEAQTVAARTYTVHNLGRMATEGADIDDTTRSQGYLGVAGETAPVAEAAEDTLGQVLLYQGTVIDAMYSTECGGMTAIGAVDQPYLRAVADPVCAEKPPWTYRLSKAAVGQLIDPSVAESLKDIDASALDESGRVSSVIVTLADGTQRSLTGPKFRQLLGYDKLRSTHFTVKVDHGSLIFTGQGWGHGLGMCQAGAITRASGPNGESYQQILADYYPGTQLTALNSDLIVRPVAPSISPAQLSMSNGHPVLTP